jgi:hypothetical protein
MDASGAVLGPMGAGAPGPANQKTLLALETAASVGNQYKPSPL